MEHDNDKILDAFSQCLSDRTQTALTRSQKAVLTACLQNSRSQYRDIAATTGYSPKTLRDSGAKLFKSVKAVVGRSVKKSTCGQILKEWYEQQVTFKQNHLFGREADFQNLLNAIRVEGRRLIGVSGPPRIGKTYLVQRLCQHLTHVDAFETAIWCQAPQLKTVDLLYQYVLVHLGEQPFSGQLPAPAALNHLLETRRLLVVIEKTEVLQASGAAGGQFQSNSAGYEQWLRSLLENQRLQSCVILVCRRSPQCLQMSHDLLLLHPLKPVSASAAAELLRHQELHTYSTQQLQELAQFCGCNPGVLVAAAHKITTSGTQDLRDFVQYPLLTPHADDPLWQAALDDLSAKEYEMLGWLLLYPDVMIQRQGNGIVLNDRLSKSLLPVLRSLYHQGLAAVAPTGAYFIPTEWLRHVVARHRLQRLAIAFCQEDIEFLGQIPLVVSQAPLWRRQWLQQHLLEALGEQLEQIEEQAWTSRYRLDKINAMLARISTQPEQQSGYEAGNLLNLAVALKVPLNQLKLTGHSVQYADLWAAREEIDLTGCQLPKTTLPIALRGTLVAALAPNSPIIAIGDQTGQVLCWLREGPSFALYRFTQLTDEDGHPLPISHLTFGEDDTLAVVAGQTIYRWWLGEIGADPKALMQISAPVSSLTCNSDEWVAAGLQDGRIAVWYDPLEQQLELRRHLGRVQEIVANPTRYSPRLMSRGMSDRILLWDVSQPDAEPQEVRPERHIFFGLTWHEGQPVSAAYVGAQFLLRRDDGTTQPLPSSEPISLICFSQNGRYLAALKSKVIEIYRLTDFDRLASLPNQDMLISMHVSNDGRWLVTVGQAKSDQPVTVKIWDIKARQTDWQIIAEPLRELSTTPKPMLKLQHCQGLSTIERAYWQSQGVTL